MKGLFFATVFFLFTSEVHGIKVSVQPFSCELPQCESQSGVGMAKAISSALTKRGYEVVERWGGPSYIIQGEIKDFDLQSPDALVSLEVKIVDAKAGRLLKILNADGHSYESQGGDFSFPYEFSRWRGKPAENAIVSAVSKIVEKILSVIEEKDVQIQTTTTIAKPVEKRQLPSEEVSGQIKGGSKFIRGENFIFFTDLSKYGIGDVPRGLKIDGQVEIADFMGKKWIRAISKDGKIVKVLDLPKDWWIETSYYMVSKEPESWIRVSFGIGGPSSERKLNVRFYPKEELMWKDIELKGISVPRRGVVHTVAFSKRGSILKVFIDGVMVVNEMEEELGIRGSEIKGEQGFFVMFEHVDPSKGNEFLLGDIRIGGYK